MLWMLMDKLIRSWLDRGLSVSAYAAFGRTKGMSIPSILYRIDTRTTAKASGKYCHSQSLSHMVGSQILFKYSVSVLPYNLNRNYDYSFAYYVLLLSILILLLKKK